MSELDRVYYNARKMEINDNSKLVFMSDCHRGDGSAADNFEKNKNLFFAALTRYFRESYTYIELGDGDELWENVCMCDILNEHGEVFLKLLKFSKKNRFYMLYGNHDMVKRSELSWEYYNQETQCKCTIPFTALESIVLRYQNNDILLIHGHQADFFNNKLWRLGKFLVRHVWRPLELVGVKDPTSAVKNEKRKSKVEQQLSDWASEHNRIIIAGHTHKIMFPKAGEGMYFNDGCCVNTSGVTAIEIESGYISIVKWQYKTKEDGTVYVGKTLINGPEPLIDYFKFNLVPSKVSVPSAHP